MGPQGVCGTLNYCNVSTTCAGSNSSSMTCLVCQAQSAALAEIIPTLTAIAQQFEQADYSYRQFYYQSSTMGTNSNWQWVYNYCQAQNPAIPQTQCCIPGGANSPCKAPTVQNTSSNQGSSGATGSSTSSSASSGVNSTFPSPNDSGNPQGPGTIAVTNLYWPFAIQPTLKSVDFIGTVVNGDYIVQLSQVVSNIISQQPSSGALSSAASTGWILAGGYYYAISQVNNNNLTDAMPTLSVSIPTNISQTTLSGYRNNFDAASTLASAAAAAAANAGSTTSGATSINVSISLPSTASVLNGPLNSTFNSIGSAFVANVSNSSATSTAPAGTTTASVTATTTSNPIGSSSWTNPLSQLQMLGHILIIVVEVLFPVILAVAIGMGFASSIDAVVMGNGVENPLSITAMVFWMMVVPALYGLMGIMLSFGGLLGIYTPLIPYIVFTFGAIGWLISTVEAMVAGPLVALGILSPTGEHEILGKAAPALMLLFNIFLRPSLMIFGLMASMLLASVVVYMINTLFWTTVVQAIGSFQGTAGASAYADPLEMCIFIGAYCTLIVSALNKCFAAIYILPERVMTWIGGPQGASAGEADALSEGKSSISGATSGASRGMDSGRGQAESMTGKQRGAEKGQADAQTKNAKLKQKEARQKAKDEKNNG